MKRYLVTLTGRANLGCKGNKLREHDLCYSYVFGKNKDEAISKFWKQISNCSGLKGFERRDFKITAERWEKDSFLDVNGDVVTDIERAIPFDLLASLELIHDEHYKNYHLAIPLDFKIEETTNQAQELTDEPQESSEPVAQENIQPEHEDATESNSEPHSQPVHHLNGAPRLFKKSKRLEIPKTEIDKWNRMLESAKGSSTYYTFTLWHEGNDEHGRWFALGHGDIRAHMISHPSDCYFIKKIKENTWLYFEDCAGIQERWLLSDVARAFFLPEPSDDERNDSRGSQKASESSSDSSNEIIKESSENSTEAKPEHQRDVSIYSLGHDDKIFFLVKEREENGLWAYYSADSNELLWSSAERFSKGDLIGMYEYGYFLSDLVAKRKNKALALELLEKNGAPSDVIVELRNSISEIDEEIARLY